MKAFILLFLLSCSQFRSTKLHDNNTLEFNRKASEIGSPYKVLIDLPYFEKDAESLVKSVTMALAEADKKLLQVAKLPKKSINFENTLQALENIYYEVGLVGSRVHLLSSTSPIKELQKKALELENTISKWYVDTSSREDIYMVVKQLDGSKLKNEDRKLFKETMRDFKRLGLHLSKKKRKEIQDLRNEISKLKNDIQNNISESNKETILLTENEVKGLPKDVMAKLKKDKNGNYIVSIGVTHIVRGIILNSPQEQVRKKVVTARSKRAQKSNEKLIKDVLYKRAKLAKLLGYKNWADYKIEVKMAKNSKRAIRFVDSLINGLNKKFYREKKELEKLKREETKNPRARLKSWDISYYQRIYDKKNFDLDTNELKKYFLYDKTLNGMFEIFESIFSIDIHFVEAPYVWHESVKLIRIDDKKTKKPQGYLYLDMFPRPQTGKYGHFAMFTIRPGRTLNGQISRRPVAALICNFPEKEPQLLEIGEVETLFHEFGHALHGILTQVKHASFAGTRVPGDFVEAPSQMLENFVYDKNVLDSFAVNYQDPNDKIPSDTLKKLKASKLSSVGMMYRRQLSFGKMDLTIHSKRHPYNAQNVIAETNKILSTVSLAPPKGTSFITAFGHLFGGYDAGYYGYAWADSIAADMASVFEKSPKGFLDPEIGMRLRREIYQTGDSRDVNTSIQKFLQRKPNNKAFLKKLGI